MVEMTDVTVPGAHPPPAVQEEYDLLIAFLLILTRDRFDETRGRSPVNLAQRISNTKIT